MFQQFVSVSFILVPDLHGEEYEYAKCNLSFSSHFSSFELGSSCLDHSQLGIVFFWYSHDHV